ncbi:MAG: BamA/TamA family outer membrane protein [Prevotella sp.]|uniref:translocation and assembly module lipoprotein TamL n=1 Tax=Prevotella sp. TaxID=59823 RepID=UPI002A2788B5|nr:BamA/TamA family outer membrane protein [Prevotella sp.]MDD7318651.1 BamA/TamA family outer membrane protein [Prevotellaceae bacterium]MDY4019393.1 BamA/TamA family outer membrane protein [Prevotella sp.]
MKKRCGKPCFCLLVMCLSALILVGCSTQKFVPEGKYLLSKVEIKSDDKALDVEMLRQYIRQKGNSKWFSMFKVPLRTYSLAGRDSTKWINRTLKNIGEKPVIYDSVQAEMSRKDLVTAMRNMGYMNAQVVLNERYKGKKINLEYQLQPGEPFYIRNVEYNIEDSVIEKLLGFDDPANRGIHSGMQFTVANLNNERKRIANLLHNSGYYRFNTDFIRFTADSTHNAREVDVVLHLLRYKPNNNAEETLHPRYFIGSVKHVGIGDEDVHLREKVLNDNTMIDVGRPYSAHALQRTYSNFAKLGALGYTNISFNERRDTTLLDCVIHTSRRKPNSISFQPEGTNTAGNLGAAASVMWTNRNLFRGSEQLSVELRGAYEAITGLEGYQNQNYTELGVEAKLEFPRFLAPFLSKSFRRNSRATSELSVSFDMQDRPEFHRRVFSAAWRYKWNDVGHHAAYRLDLLDLNYIYMPWISSTFKNDYLDNAGSRNAILRYNYEDMFIAKIGFGLSYNNGIRALRMSIETSGNVLNALSNVVKGKKNEEGQYTIFNIAYAQYVKFDVDYSRLYRFDKHNALALHASFGIAYPYGNSKVLPFDKRYFGGGANSVRGWHVRGLGPGRFKGTDGAIDFINQTGDMKLDMNVEYRTFLFWKIDGALFVDAGNIWTLRNYAEQPGGQFSFKDFYKEIAVAYGCGLRLNLGYFIMRFDLGMKAVNPAYETSDEHYPVLSPKFSRDFAFHFAVGLPF